MAKEFKVGSMKIDEQEKTYANFVRRGIQVASLSIGVLIFIALVNS